VADVCVFDPTPLVTVTTEVGESGDDIHFHAGGQGLWVARMVAVLGVDAVLCTAVGGESGQVLLTLLEREEVEVRTVDVEAASGAYVHDRRSGEREEVAAAPPAPLGRHDADELYGAALVSGLDCGTVVLTGPADRDAVEPDLYRRLAVDLVGNGATVVTDVAGDHLRAALEPGLALVKVDADQLAASGFSEGTGGAEVLDGIQRLHDEGARQAVVTRGADPTLALVDGRLLEVSAPELEPIDSRGSGDSFAAALAAIVASGGTTEDALRLGAAAGALNVTRRGLGTGSRDEIRDLAPMVEISERRLPTKQV